MAMLDGGPGPGESNGYNWAAPFGYWSVSLSGNWRIIFRFEGQDVYDVDLIDYH